MPPEEASDSGVSIVSRELSAEERSRVAGIERLLSSEDRSSYRRTQEELSKEWGVSVRTIQRMVKRWREEGLSGLLRSPRRDKGDRQTEKEWCKYILEMWRKGNKDGRRLSRAQEERPEEAESEACLSLWELERLLVRHIVDSYNSKVDARMGDQSRITRWCDFQNSQATFSLKTSK